jgi:glycolate oxidase
VAHKSSRLQDSLAKIVGRQGVSASPEDLVAHGYDASAPAADQPPIAVVSPGCTSEVVELVRFANTSSIPIVARGSATSLSGGAIPLQGAIVLSTRRLNRILGFNTANLTARAEPGVFTAEFAVAAQAVGLFYPPDPGSMNVSTLGGNVATNAGGLRGLKYGVTGDYITGLEIVLASGDVLRTGTECKKDVAGYNLTALFVGSEGSLGVITQIGLRLIPLPDAQRTMAAYFTDVSLSAQVVADIIKARIIPVTLELLDQTCLESIEAHAQLGLPTEAGAMLLIEVDGPALQLDGEIEQITRICEHHHAVRIDIARNQSEAEGLKAARRTTLAALARMKPTTILEDVTVPRDKIPDMVRRIQAIAKRHDVQIALFGHAGDGNLHPTGMTDARDTVELSRVEAAFDEIFSAAIELGGTITGEHGIGIKKLHVLPRQVGPIGIKTMRAVKTALDPQNLLNPGKIIAA